jgi:hypothetical protein
MSTQSVIKARLEADATLLAIATGGVWDYDETGRLGINRGNTTAAFDATTGVIKPCVLVRARSAVPDFILRDIDGQYNSVRQVVEIWMYQDSGYTTIETMKSRVYALLNATQVTGAFFVSWAGDIGEQFDYDLNACVERSDYLVNTYRSV